MVRFAGILTLPPVKMIYRRIRVLLQEQQKEIIPACWKRSV
nr:MAG TPA: hypothetical protein [Caudoviricetes sp.]